MLNMNYGQGNGFGARGCNSCPQGGMGGFGQMGMGGMSGMSGMDPMMGQMNSMMNMFTMSMMSMMTQLMGMMAGQMPMSGAAGQFGGAQGGGGSSPLNGFLGGDGASVGDGGGSGTATATAPTGSGAGIGPTDGSTTPSTQNFINKALSHQGAPYVFGAQGPNKFDCSGLVYYALKEAGVSGGRQTARGYQEKYKNSAITKKEDLKPGDLVFFHSANTRGIPKGQATHIEIYLGNGKTMGTDSPKEGAKVEPINWDTFIGGARVPELNK